MNRAVAAALLLALLVSGPVARADDADPDSPSSLRGRVGVDRAEALLASASIEDRLRGLERLGSAGTPRALARLARTLQPSGSAATPEERLTAVRALAPFATDPSVERALVRVMAGHATPPSGVTRSPLDSLAEESAALALAAAGTSSALSTLGKTLAGPGRAPHSAHAALVAHPPKDIAAVIGPTMRPTLELAETLADLKDPRSADALRAIVLGGGPRERAVAAVALARLGDDEAVPLARSWQDPKTLPLLRVAGARILVESRAKDAPAALRPLLESAETTRDATTLATELDVVDPGLVAPLARVLASPDSGDPAPIIAAIGRAGTNEAVQALAALVPDARRGILAAEALARISGKAAADALLRALAAPSTRRLAARALALRAVVTRDTVNGLDAALTSLAASKERADRDVAASCRAALAPKSLEEALKPGDFAADASLAPLAFLASDKATTHLAARITEAPTEQTRTALAFVLALPGARDRVPTSALVSLVDGKSIAAPLAAFALAARDEPRLRPALRALLGGDDAELRAHAALGLAYSKASDAAGLLEAAYRFETEPAVRRAVARALAALRGAAKSRTLELARTLDPDPTVRDAARTPPAAPSRPRGDVTLLVPRGGPASNGLAAIRLEDGLLLPVVLGESGVSLAGGLPEGSVAVEVAPAHGREDDSRRGAIGNEKSDPGKGTERTP